jgi:type I restriction enzyme, R subunit
VSGQFPVVENGIKRRPDVVVFVNGIPIAVIELKNPGGEQATLHSAFNQLQTYKAQIPSLFRANALLVTSDGLHARVGSLTAKRRTRVAALAPIGNSRSRSW